MSKETTIVGVAALIIGFLIGVMVGGKFMAGSKAPAGQAAIQQGSAGMPNPGQSAARIAELEQLVAKDPKNLQAWITLGNDYFDSNQAQKSVQAYGKALELDPNNANVLTDQGVMFRALGFYDRALANFDKANKLDPKHLQSLFNTGIVYAVDLKQPAKAKAVFEALLQKDQTSDLARQAREMLQQLPAGK
ncbi:MAG: tetratricopeptide repeat protein [Trichlorobacter sp.]|uniref:tetratricopeptide repeat protein n=1 Tax=Trichlorobacter sp. TaxID=2911007 RepID=UPI00255D1791|nr:tetratricopeptide repeat protein [Trichlorobacter sp.]MDK9719420.1 tetratricopeptide repeat protein [Trichlorobacter sp.]